MDIFLTIAIALLLCVMLAGAVVLVNVISKGDDLPTSRQNGWPTVVAGGNLSDETNARFDFDLAADSWAADGHFVASAWQSDDSHYLDQPSFGDIDIEASLFNTWINPASGLPMIYDSPAGVDVGGNLYGFNNDDLFNAHAHGSSGADLDSWSSHDVSCSFDSGLGSWS